VIDLFSSSRECQDAKTFAAAHIIEPTPYWWHISDTIAKKDRKLKNLSTNNLQLQAWEG
jgi:hypothetical protein